MNAPRPPNPYQTAASQGAINAAQQQANAAYQVPANQVGFYGTQNTVQTGTRTIPAVYTTNKKGKQKLVTPAQEVPIYTTTTSLSPEQQQLLNQQQQFGQATNALGIAQVGRLSDLLSQPLDLSNDSVTGYITDLYRKRLDPIWDQRQQQLETELRNQGLQPNADPRSAWGAAMANFNQGRNDAYDQILRSARGQAVQEMVLGRQEPINETTALMSGGQVSLPQFNQWNAGATGQPVDLAALQANNYNQQMAAHNAMLGGLAGLGGAGLNAAGMAAGGWNIPKVR